MGRKRKGDFGADEAIDLLGQLLDLWKKGGNQQNRKLKSLVKTSKQTKKSITRLKANLAKTDLPPQMKAQVESLHDSILEDLEIVDEWVEEDKDVSKYLVLIPIVKPVLMLLLPAISIYLGTLQIGHGVVVAGVAAAVCGLIFYRKEVEDFAAAWQGTFDKQYKEMSQTFKEYDERMKEFLETQQQLREARAFDVSAILAEYPDAKKFWIDQFGADRQAVPTSQFIEVLLDWRHKLDISRGIKIQPLTEKERETVYQTIRDIVDRNRDGDVSPTELANVLSYFGPLHQTVPKMRCLVSRDEDGEPIREPWFIWTEVGSKEIEQKLQESSQCPSFVVRASESRRSMFAVSQLSKTRKFTKYLVENQQRRVHHWRQNDIRDWALDRLILTDYVPGKSGALTLSKKRKELVERSINLNMINDAKALFAVGKNKAELRTEWDYVSTGDVRLFIEAYKGEGLSKETHKRLHRVFSRIRSIEVAEGKSESIEGLYSDAALRSGMQQIVRSLREIQMDVESDQARETGKGKDNNESLGVVKRHFSRLVSAASTIPSLQKQLTSNLSSPLGFGEKKFSFTAKSSRLLLSPSSPSSTSPDKPPAGPDGLGALAPEYYDHKLAAAEEDRSPAEAEDAKVEVSDLIQRMGESRLSLDSKSALETFALEVTPLTLRIRMRAEIERIKSKEVPRPLSIVEMVDGTRRLLQRVSWTSSEDAEGWALAHFGPRSPFAALFASIVSVPSLAEECLKVSKDGDFVAFLGDHFDAAGGLEETAGADDEYDTRLSAKDVGRAGEDAKRLIDSSSFAAAGNATVRSRAVRDWLMTTAMPPVTRAIITEALENAKEAVAPGEFRDVERLAGLLGDSPRATDGKVWGRFADAVAAASRACAGIGRDASPERGKGEGAKASAEAKRRKQQRAILPLPLAQPRARKSQGGRPVTEPSEADFKGFLRQLKALRGESRHPSLWTVEAARLFIAKVLGGQMYPKVRGSTGWTEEQGARAQRAASRALLHLGVDGNRLLMLTRDDVRAALTPGVSGRESAWRAPEAGEDTKGGARAGEAVPGTVRAVVEALKLLRLDLQLGYRYNGFSCDRVHFCYPTVAEFVREEITGPAGVRAFRDPDARVEFDVRGAALTSRAGRFVGGGARVLNTRLSREVRKFLPRVAQRALFYDHDPAAFGAVLNWFLHGEWLVAGGGGGASKVTPALVGEVAMDLLADRPPAREGFAAGDLVILTEPEDGGRRWDAAHVYKVARREPVPSGGYRYGVRRVRVRAARLRDEAEGDFGYRYAAAETGDPEVVVPHERLGRYHEYHMEALGRLRAAGAQDGEEEEAARRLRKDAEDRPPMRAQPPVVKKKEARSMYTIADYVEDLGVEEVVEFPGGGGAASAREEAVVEHRREVSDDPPDYEVDDVVEIDSYSPMPSDAAAAGYKPGDPVQYLSGSMNKWFDAAVVSVGPGTIRVRIDVSGMCRDAKPSNVRRRPGSEAPPPKQKRPALHRQSSAAQHEWRPGDECAYLSRTRLKWFPAVVERLLGNGKIMVRVGGEPKTADADQIRPRGETDEDVLSPTEYDQERKKYNKARSTDYVPMDTGGAVEFTEPETKYDVMEADDMIDEGADSVVDVSGNYEALGVGDVEDPKEGPANPQAPQPYGKAIPLPVESNSRTARAGDEGGIETASNYETTFTAEDFGSGETKSLDNLLKPTGAWHPNMTRQEAEKRVAVTMKNNTDADHVFVFRRASRGSAGPGEELFVLTAGSREGFVTHYKVIWSKRKGVRFLPGKSVPKHLESFSECKNVVMLLKKNLGWKSPIGI